MGKLFNSAKVLTLAEQIAEQIKLAILDGVIQPGRQLPGEFDLSERFKVSRPTIRQALDILCNQKIVEVKRGRSGGHFIVPHISHENYKFFQDLLPADLKHLTINDLIEARNAIQLKSFELAKKQCTEKDLQFLQTLIPSDKDNDFVWKLIDFQTYLTRISNNHFLIANMIPLARTLRMIFLQIDVPDSIQQCYITNIGNVYTCLADKTKETSACMQNCLCECNNFIGKYLIKTE